MGNLKWLGEGIKGLEKLSNLELFLNNNKGFGMMEKNFEELGEILRE